MKLEVPNKCAPKTYWVASVIMTCGQLLRLRYDGYEEDSSGDFWCDLAPSELHPIGWCAQNGQTLQPPEGTDVSFTHARSEPCHEKACLRGFQSGPTQTWLYNHRR